MAQVEVTIKGQPQDHVVRSDSLSDDEAAKQLGSIGGVIGRMEYIVGVPWLAASGNDVRFARIISEQAPVLASAGGTIMGGVADEAW